MAKSQGLSRPVTRTVKQAKIKFWLQFGTYSWSLHVCYISRCANLIEGKEENMPFAVAIVWLEPSSQLVDCYFCLRKLWIFEGAAKMK
jgi:hypothetical protein